VAFLGQGLLKLGLGVGLVFLQFYPFNNNIRYLDRPLLYKRQKLRSFCKYFYKSNEKYAKTSD
jgi:hypothetical protein